MLSRTAENLFWIGRYIERSEYTARFANAHYHVLLEIADLEQQKAIWKGYLDGTNEIGRYTDLYGQIGTESVLAFLTLNPDNPNAMVNLVRAARDNARSIQDQLPQEAWQHLNEFNLRLKGLTTAELREAPHNILGHIQHTCYTLDGVAESTMLHDEGWYFFRLGKNIERAGGTARLLMHPILTTAAPELEALSEYHARIALLQASGGYEAYRKTYRSDVTQANIADFLLFDYRFPRSIRYVASLARQFLRRLPPTEHPERRELERLVGHFDADLEFTSITEVYRMGLPAFLTEVIERIDHITNVLARVFFGSKGYDDFPAPASRTRRRPLVQQEESAVQVMKAMLAIRHQFTYRYQSPVSQVRTIIRVAPPQHYGRQRRHDIQWHMEPPADYRHFVDAFGNLVWQLDHSRVETEIVCTVDMRVETQATYHQNGSLTMLGTSQEGSDCTVEPVEFMQLTPLVDDSVALKHHANQLRERGIHAAELAETLLHQVGEHMRYQPGSTHVDTPASEAFSRATGVCQDYTHVMLSLCRLSGVPSRYVSGYLPGEGQMHAWVEVLLPTGRDNAPTWVAYDPTHQRRCNEHYVTVAIGRDYQDVAPTSGYYSGEAANVLNSTIAVVVESHGPAEQWLRGPLPGQGRFINGDPAQQ